MRDDLISELELKPDHDNKIDFEALSERYRKLSEEVDKRIKEIRKKRGFIKT